MLLVYAQVARLALGRVFVIELRPHVRHDTLFKAHVHSIVQAGTPLAIDIPVESVTSIQVVCLSKGDNVCIRACDNSARVGVVLPSISRGLMSCVECRC
jgi:hypothetical protein